MRDRADVDNRTEARLNKVEGLVAAVASLQTDVAHIKTNTEEIIRHVKETNNRVGHLESWQDRVIGGAIVIVFLIGAYGLIEKLA